MRVPKALSIAGSDSGGGAGIQADLKTFSAFRVFGLSVVTAVTAQDTVGVHGVHDVPPEFVALQIDAVLGDLGADAVKVGMLSTAATIRAVGDRLRVWRQERVVLDPVMLATSGDALLQSDAVDALRRDILPLAFVVTPNLDEAAVLAEMPVKTEADMAEAARRIHVRGPRHVLVKGGHLADAATDVLWDGRTLTRFAGERLARNAHGTGCTLSAAIAAGLARGADLEPAVRDAKRYVTAAIRAGFAAGRGAGVLRHFVEGW